MKKSNVKDINSIYQNIFDGSMPRLVSSELDRSEYYSNYIRTYLERDI